MTGVITAAAIGAGASLAGTGASLLASGSKGGGTAAAAQNLAMQNYLQSKQMNQQYAMQTATQVDAEGNKLVYDASTNSWIPLLSERGLQVQAAGQAAQDIERRKYFGRGQYEDEQAAARRFEAGGEARKLMATMKNQYGAPTREGVEGANKVYGVTAATEPADLIKSGAAAAQLRTGGNATGLAQGIDAIDRKSAQGVRTELARPQTGAFDEAFSRWVDPKLAEYKAFESAAAPPGQAPPGTGTEALSAQVAARAAKPMQVNPYSGLGANQASAELIKAMGADKGPDYGAAFTALGANAKELYKTIYDANKKSEWDIGGSRPGGVGRAGSFGANF